MTAVSGKPSVITTARLKIHFRRVWARVLLLIRALWVVRVPVVTTTLGLVILWQFSQAQDMFVDSSQSKRQLFFLVPMLLVWAFPTYYASRELLETDERFNQHAAVYRNFARIIRDCIPFLLGLLTFVAVLIGMSKAGDILLALEKNAPNKNSIGQIESALTALRHHEVLLVTALLVFVLFILKFPRLRDIFQRPAVKRLVKFVPGWGWVSCLLFIFFVLLTFMILFPVRIAEWFPRGFSIPFILGGWLPLLSYLGSIGRRLRVPIITFVGAALVVLNAWWGNDHAVRLINAAQTAGHPVDTQRMPLDQAVTLWMEENNCNGTPTTCPRPIIIAAAGGASRAAFFMASVLGEFMDAKQQDVTPDMVRKQLFAISSVSGGSMGANMVTTALNERNNNTAAPCVQPDDPLSTGKAIKDWRGCFEALTSGDFLTPVIFGLAYHDAFGFLPIRDRAALLEDAWSRRYDELIPHSSTVPPPCTGLNCPFLTLRPQKGHWIPILILNGTSEKTGGRIVTTALATKYTADNKKCSKLFPGAHQFYDLLYSEAECDNPGPQAEQNSGSQALDDVRISTAALNSARFPIISPPGAVRISATKQIVDHILDGGYFDNYGIESATDLVKAIHEVQPKLTPLVIVITNDPSDEQFPSDRSASNIDDPTQKEQQALKGPSTEFVPDITGPVNTVFNNRNLRGVITYVQSSKDLGWLNKNCGQSSVHVAVWSDTISLSWWLSTLDQDYLHEQIDKSDKNNSQALAEIWQILNARPGCSPTSG
jgi:hypothetical protein